MPSLDRLKDKVLKIILLQGRGSKKTKESPDKHHDDKLKNILEEVDQVAKAIFMTGLPKGDGVSPTRETSLRKKQLENERQVIEKTLERLSQLEDEKDSVSRSLGLGSRRKCLLHSSRVLLSYFVCHCHCHRKRRLLAPTYLAGDAPLIITNKSRELLV